MLLLSLILCSVTCCDIKTYLLWTPTYHVQMLISWLQSAEI